VLAVDIEEYFEIEEEERRQNEQASWDWDEMMKRMEELEAAEERGGDDEDEEKPAAEAPEQQAAELKAKGNDAFARRKFKDAVEFYSQAIVLDPVSHVSVLLNCCCCAERASERERELTPLCRRPMPFRFSTATAPLRTTALRSTRTH
jgi:tetratricopeptide (TPR) repeat protein